MNSWSRISRLSPHKPSWYIFKENLYNYFHFDEWKQLQSYCCYSVLTTSLLDKTFCQTSWHSVWFGPKEPLANNLIFCTNWWCLQKGFLDSIQIHFSISYAGHHRKIWTQKIQNKIYHIVWIWGQLICNFKMSKVSF